ncbi:zincin [Rhypophila decipiens]
MKFLTSASLLGAILINGATSTPIIQPRTESSPALPIQTPAAAAAPYEYDFTSGVVPSYPIHPSCNITLRRQLSRALDETIQLVNHAKTHLLLRGHDSPLVKKYFGSNNNTAHAIGFYSRIADANKLDVLFRCDDPDQNCATQDSWAGHWRGENATQETVICPLSFEKRRYLDQVCGMGYTVVGSPLNTYWATDLLHRILHVPRISEGAVEHFADDYAGVLELAKTEPHKSGIDSDTLQYFAIEAYAFDVAAPGVGCTGEEEKVGEATEVVTATSTASAGSSCHTHADGVLHCE